MKLKFGMEFEDFYSIKGIVKLDEIFLDQLKENKKVAYETITSSRQEGSKLNSDNLISIARLVSSFLRDLFELNNGNFSIKEKAFIKECRMRFTQRFAKSRINVDAVWTDQDELELNNILNGCITELAFAMNSVKWVENSKLYSRELELAVKLVSWEHRKDISYNKKKRWGVLNFPSVIDYENFLDLEVEGDLMFLSNTVYRDGFKLTDQNFKSNSLADYEATYCLYCHNRDKDTCRSGIVDKKSGEFMKSPLDIELSGCPLREKISEANYLKYLGDDIGALTIITLDNPLCAATGYRICNDCSMACIYQKQDPVNIPLIETNILWNVISLDYGFEIYSLLTRWNPLNTINPFPKAFNGRFILVVGMGPAGYSISHYMLNMGYGVVGIDGLKIEPRKDMFKPIKDFYGEYAIDNSDRIPEGFGGVAEYGITSRWDKNFLSIIRIIMERREMFSLHGGVMFGGTIKMEQAFHMGFDHVVLAMGAGESRIIDLEDIMAGGVRMASDFLMSLQLNGTYSKYSKACLQIRMPIVVVGGGLTSLDAATEALTYYPIQVEKFAMYYRLLSDRYGENAIRSQLTDHELEIAEEFLQHAHIFAQERDIAKKEDRDPDLLSILKQIGGVKIIYRDKLSKARFYRYNRYEAMHAFKEGIDFMENAVPTSIVRDKYGNIESMTIKHNNQRMSLHVRTLLLAIGTIPNTFLSQKEGVKNDNLFPSFDNSYGNGVADNFIANFDYKGHKVSILGDMHPHYAGSVVNAIASAKNAFVHIDRVIDNLCNNSSYVSADHRMNEFIQNNFSFNLDESVSFMSKIKYLLECSVVEKQEISNGGNALEILVKAPMASLNFMPGMFYKFQNYAHNNIFNIDTKLMEPIALTGAHCDNKKGEIGLIVLNSGLSSKLCAGINVNDKVVLMGPTGEPSALPHNANIMLVGGGLGNATLLPVAQKLKSQGCKVVYFAGYKSTTDVFKKDQIEQFSDIVFWSFEINDNSFTGNVVTGNVIDSINSFCRDNNDIFRSQDVDTVIVIGSHKMMYAVSNHIYQNENLFPLSNTRVIASLNSPMQCMMQGVCSQCVQRMKDIDGKEYYIYSCRNQEQSAIKIDFNGLDERLLQNSLQEKLMKMTYLANIDL